ncbi:MAG: capsular polysaccharide export protein [Thalassolituus sp.]|jgi:capsular polysaccharide export protein
MINVAIIDYYDSAQFFFRLFKNRDEGDVIIITNLISVYMLAKKNGFPARMLKNTSGKFQGCSLNKAREVISCEISTNEAVKYANGIINEIEFLMRGYDSIRLLCWSGSDIKGAAIRYVKNKYGRGRVSSLFFEISNFPGYYFVDCLGVNAESSAYLFPSYFLDDAEIISLENSFGIMQSMINVKNRQKSLPQAGRSKKITIRHFIDYGYMVIFGVKNFSFYSMFKRLVNKVRSRDLDISSYVNFNGELSDDNCFFPLQVSSDSQILLNYDGTLIDSLVEAVDWSHKLGKKLVVKLHPAETDVDCLEEIKRICDQYGVLIIDEQVASILSKVGSVVTVNSTVGFEALLMGVDVKFLGRSQFSHLKCQRDVLLYIKSYIKEGDFFSGSPIEFPTILRCE